MTPSPRPLPIPVPGSSSSNLTSKKEPVKFSSLSHPPRSNLLSSNALLSLLSLAFICLLFVCFRHVGWIMRARIKLKEMLQENLDIFLNYLASKLNMNWLRRQRIKLNDDNPFEHYDNDENHLLISDNQDELLVASRNDRRTLENRTNLIFSNPSIQVESEEDDDDEVLPQVVMPQSPLKKIVI
ncbi:hypothetical protein O181_060056 [Austropuccinia psidii MF-1]|uniref:Uncharacterized protein n=1 Tax=Austropuccinia psidii MF-1 TaxID=1389203 RepID=A0A9Q3EK68_9BASI|nr:hypothetical protein [Austropuccinia psidii MF-1]